MRENVYASTTLQCQRTTVEQMMIYAVFVLQVRWTIHIFICALCFCFCFFNGTLVIIRTTKKLNVGLYQKVTIYQV